MEKFASIFLGCYYSLRVDGPSTDESYDGYYHIDGTLNKKTVWALQTPDTKAIWWDKKNWCIGPKTKRGKKCSGENMYVGKADDDAVTAG